MTPTTPRGRGLIVDDDPGVLNVLSEMVEALHYAPARVETAAAGLAAIAIGRLFATDLLASIEREEGPITEYLHAESGPTFLLLAGLALECAVKGVLIAEDPSLVRGGQFPKWLTTHALRDLLERAHVSMDDDTREFCRRAEVAVASEGRYLVPKQWDRTERVTFFSTADPEVFQEVYATLMARLRPPSRAAGL